MEFQLSKADDRRNKIHTIFNSMFRTKVKYTSAAQNIGRCRN